MENGQPDLLTTENTDFTDIKRSSIREIRVIAGRSWRMGIIARIQRQQRPVVAH